MKNKCIDKNTRKFFITLFILLLIAFIDVNFALADNLHYTIVDYENAILNYELVGDNVSYYNSQVSKEISSAKEKIFDFQGYNREKDINYFLTKSNMSFKHSAKYIGDRDKGTIALTDIVVREVFEEIPISSSYFANLSVYSSPFELNNASGLYTNRYKRILNKIVPIEHTIILANNFILDRLTLNYKKNIIRNTLLHEIGHLIQREEPEMYELFKDMYVNDIEVNNNNWHYNIDEHFAEEFKYFISKQMKSYGYEPIKPRTHLKRYKETEDLFKNYLKKKRPIRSL